MKLHGKHLVLAVTLACLSSGVQAASSDYIAVNPEGVKPTATGSASVAVGINTKASGRDSFAAGISSNASGRSSTAVGVGSNASGYRSIAVGNGGVAGADNAIGIGGNASGQSAISMGYQSVASGLNNVAIGKTAVANGGTSMAIGSNSKTYDADNIATDATSLANLISNYTIDGYPISAVDTSMTGSAQVAVGTNSHAAGWGASALGYQAYALNSQASALGDDAKAMGYASSAVGTHSYASGKNSTALGNGAEALGNQSNAIGSGSAATADKSIAVGWGAGASGANAIAIGTSTGAVKTWYTQGNAQSAHATELDQWAASGDRSIALGTDTLANASDSVGIGTLATAVVSGGVALGSESVANRAALTGVSTSASATAAANQVYAMDNSSAADKAAIVATVQGGQGAVSVGVDGQTRQITNVAAGSEDSDAVNVSQLKAVANTIKDVEVAAGNNVTVTSTTDGNKTTYTVAAKGTSIAAGDNSVIVNNDGNNNYTIAVSDDIKNQINNNTTNIDTIEQRLDNIKGVEVEAGNNVTVTSKTDGNKTTYTVSAKGTSISAADNSVTVNNDGNNNYTIAVSDDIKNQVNSNTTNINNMGQGINNLGQRINNLDSRVNKVGAGAAALAGLHPLDFNPDDKWNFAVGYGNYSNANAVALGAFYRPNEDMMLNVASTMGNGENMLSAGLSFNVGQSSGVSRSRVAMAKEIESLQARLAQLESRLANNTVSVSTNYAQVNVEFPDVPENHWAYDYVEDLAKKGLLVGYPDGEFKGDRTMTRYEFAAVMYRALQNGAPIDGNMARMTNEFEPEMQAVQQADRFRVDRVHGDENDRYKVERIRVNSEDKQTRDVYGGLISNNK
ncbi:S-layer homology domain-containing protein [Veillonella caviae]|uniref:S-layer homology domain-containing protein n=1 Tax=Veillonella caviae TaxID=248316 RepID=UPI0023F2A8E7|nr:S-layer homology domain-containing protein [Veillonella caviae]MCI6407018.1 S-layer homology domain-containing protein [Veillonella caviae]